MLSFIFALSFLAVFIWPPLIPVAPIPSHSRTISTQTLEMFDGVPANLDLINRVPSNITVPEGDVLYWLSRNVPVTNISVGSPPRMIPVMLDTGSYFIFVQGPTNLGLNIEWLADIPDSNAETIEESVFPTFLTDALVQELCLKTEGKIPKLIGGSFFLDLNDLVFDFTTGKERVGLFPREKSVNKSALMNPLDTS
jgi:hypothetical protein